MPFLPGQVLGQGPAHRLFAGGLVERCVWGEPFIGRCYLALGRDLGGTHSGLQF